MEENNEELKDDQFQNKVDEGHEEKGGEIGEEKAEEQKEEKVEEKLEEKMEDKIEEKAEEKVEEKSDEKIEENLEVKEEKVEEKKEEKLNDIIDENHEDKEKEEEKENDEANSRQNLEEKIEKNEEENHVENNFVKEERIDSNFDEKDDKKEEKNEEKLEIKEEVKESQEEKPEQNIKEEIIENHIEVESEEKQENTKEENREKEDIKMERLNGVQINHDYILRICLVGDAGVGKTSLLTRFCDNTFDNNYTSTIGVDFKVVTLKYKNIITKLHIWDTAGQERFKSMAINYFRSSHGFMFIYDITEKESFENIQNWIDLAFSNSNTVGINFLVGNKSDIENQRKITKDSAKDFANEKNLIFFETSAKSSENVEKVFEFFAYKLIQYFLSNKDKYDNSDLSGTKISKNAKDINPNKEEESKCAC